MYKATNPFFMMQKMFTLTIDNMLLCLVKRNTKKQEKQNNPCHPGCSVWTQTLRSATELGFLGFLYGLLRNETGWGGKEGGGTSLTQK